MFELNFKTVDDINRYLTLMTVGAVNIQIFRSRFLIMHYNIRNIFISLYIILINANDI